MSQPVRNEMLPRLRQRYIKRNREGRSHMLDEFCEQFGYDRKHAIKLLGGKAGWGGDPEVPKGRPRVYGEDVSDVLWEIWKMSEEPCGKRLVALLPLWLPHYQKAYRPLSRKVRRKVLAISPAQADRLLAPRKSEDERRRRCGTKPGGLLKNQIPIRTRFDEVIGPGWMEADTVAHCGGSMEGNFIWSVTFTDIHTGWTCLRATWNKGEKGVVDALTEVEGILPFDLKGFDCDNGSEFLNWHLLRYLRNRQEKPVYFTRSRPYKKDDNGHVEQKNWTHVRQLLGYGRLEDPEMVEQINQLYRDVWEPLNNFFLPSTKLKKKTRIGAKVRRQHEAPMTPCDRLLACPEVPQKIKAQLKRQRKALNPFALKHELEERLKPILEHAHPARRPPGFLPDGAKNDTTTTKHLVS